MMNVCNLILFRVGSVIIIYFFSLAGLKPLWCFTVPC